MQKEENELGEWRLISCLWVNSANIDSLVVNISEVYYWLPLQLLFVVLFIVRFLVE